MGPNDEKKARELQVVHCPTRHHCPVAAVCAAGQTLSEQPVQATPSAAMPPLFPLVAQVEPGQTVWSDLKFEQRVTVIREGVFSCIYASSNGEENALSLFGSGDLLGLDGLYLPHEIGGACYLKSLGQGSLCSFPAKPFKHHLEELPSPLRETILSCVFVNPTSAALDHIRTLSMPTTRDRLCMLFARLRELYAREGRNLVELNLTHSEVAALVASDRVSTTRALHKMEEEGLVSLGYRSIRLDRLPEGRDGRSYESLSLHFHPEASGGVGVR